MRPKLQVDSIDRTPADGEAQGTIDPARLDCFVGDAPAQPATEDVLKAAKKLFPRDKLSQSIYETHVKFLVSADAFHFPGLFGERGVLGKLRLMLEGENGLTKGVVDLFCREMMEKPRFLGVPLTRIKPLMLKRMTEGREHATSSFENSVRCVKSLKNGDTTEAIRYHGSAMYFMGRSYQLMGDIQRDWDIAHARARSAADALHDGRGGSRSKSNEVRRLWSSGKYSSREVCAVQECDALNMSYSAARRALRNTPDPT
jgi:hypothetical protein